MLSVPTISPYEQSGGKGERGSRETFPVRNGGRAVISMAAVAGGRPLGGLEDAPSGCRGPAKSDGGPSIFCWRCAGVAEWWTVDTPGVKGGVLISRVTSPSNTPSLVSWCGPRMQRSSGSGSGRATCRCRLWPPGRQKRKGDPFRCSKTPCPACWGTRFPLIEFGVQQPEIRHLPFVLYLFFPICKLSANQPALLHSVCTLQVCVRVCVSGSCIPRFQPIPGYLRGLC